jgi:hypothetical protein
MILSPAAKARTERRAASRQTCSLQAVVVASGQPCLVIDQSGGGLRLRFARPYDGHANLVVVLVDSGQAFALTPRWTDGAEMGAAITAQCDLNGLVPGAFAGARQAWLRMGRRSNDL